MRILTRLCFTFCPFLLVPLFSVLVRAIETVDPLKEDPECWYPDRFYPTSIEPVHVYATEGAPLTISCSVDARCRSRYNASSVYFLKTVPEFYTNSSRVRLASPHRIQLEIPAVQEWRDRGLWLCLVDGVPGHGLAKYTAHVDFRQPKEPVITGCLVTNWDGMKCDWVPTYQDQLHQTLDRNFRYKMIYSSRTRLPEYCRASTTEVRPSPYNIFGNTCVLPRSDTEDNSFQMGSVYNVTVRAESGSAFRIGHLTNFNTNLHVKPNPPENIVMNTYNRSHSNITWSPPVTSWSGVATWSLNYSVTIQSKHQNSTIYTNNTEYILAVHPYTTYSVSVRVRPVQGGYWSEAMSRQTTTDTRAPDRNPEIFPSGYEYMDASCIDSCLVTVYWKPLNEWELGGPDFTYVILVRTTQSGGDNADHWAIMKVISDYQQGKASFNVSARQRTDVTITSHNSLDEPANEEFIQIEPLDQRLDISETLVVEGTYNIGSDMDSSLVHLWLDGEASHLDSSATYVVMWQKPGYKDCSSQCGGWLVLPSFNYDVTVTLPHHYRLYEYSLSKIITQRDGRMRTSGIIRQDGCLYGYDSDSQVAPPTDVRIVAVTKTSLTLTWNVPRCRPNAAYPASYRVYYCEKDDNIDDCKQPTRITELYVPWNVTRAILTDLEEGTAYVVYMNSQSYHSNTPSIRVMATGPIPSVTLQGYSAGVIVGFFLASVFAVIMAGFGIRCYWRKCNKIKNWFNKGIAIKMPIDVTDGQNIAEHTLEQVDTYFKREYMLSETSDDSGRYSAGLSDMCGAARRSFSTTYTDSGGDTLGQYVRRPSTGSRPDMCGPKETGHQCLHTPDEKYPDLNKYNQVIYLSSGGNATAGDLHNITAGGYVSIPAGPYDAECTKSVMNHIEGSDEDRNGGDASDDDSPPKPNTKQNGNTVISCIDSLDAEYSQPDGGDNAETDDDPSTCAPQNNCVTSIDNDVTVNDTPRDLSMSASRSCMNNDVCGGYVAHDIAMAMPVPGSHVYKLDQSTDYVAHSQVL